MTTIEVTVSENITAALDAAAALGEDQSEPMGAIATMMAAFTKRNFLRQSSPAGVPWTKRHPKSIGAHPILRLTGDLFGSIREDSGRDFASAGPEASGGAAIYGRIHQFGGTIAAKAGKALATPFGVFKQVTMPARPYVGWNDEMESRALDILTRHAKAVLTPGGALP